MLQVLPPLYTTVTFILHQLLLILHFVVTSSSTESMQLPKRSGLDRDRDRYHNAMQTIQCMCEALTTVQISTDPTSFEMS